MKIIMMLLLLASLASAQLIDVRFGHVESTSSRTEVEVGTTGFWYCDVTTMVNGSSGDEAADDFAVEATGYVDRAVMWILDDSIASAELRLKITVKNDTLPLSSDAVIIDDQFTILSSDSVGVVYGITARKVVLDLGSGVLLDSGGEYWLHTFPNSAGYYLVDPANDEINYGVPTCKLKEAGWEYITTNLDSFFTLHSSEDLVQRTNSPMIRSLEDNNLEMTFAADTSSLIKEIFSSIPIGQPADSASTRWSILYGQGAIQFFNYEDSLVVSIDSLGNIVSYGTIDTVVVGSDSLRFQGGLYLDKL